MAHLYKDFNDFAKSKYVDRKELWKLGEEEKRQKMFEYSEAIRTSTTLYVGNIAFDTRESQVWELFSRCGVVKAVIMGIDRIHKTPCGFCFVEYARREEAEDAMKYLASCKVDDRALRIDWDRGNVLQEKRHYGRGASGGQVRDEYRDDLDTQRGGWGRKKAQELQKEFNLEMPVIESGPQVQYEEKNLGEKRGRGFFANRKPRHEGRREWDKKEDPKDSLRVQRESIRDRQPVGPSFNNNKGRYRMRADDEAKDGSGEEDDYVPDAKRRRR